MHRVIRSETPRSTGLALSYPRHTPARIAASEARIVELLAVREVHSQQRNTTKVRNLNVQIEGLRRWLRVAQATA